MTTDEARRLHLGETLEMEVGKPSEYAEQKGTVVQKDRNGFTTHWDNPELPDDWCPFEAQQRLAKMQRTGAPKRHETPEEAAALAAQEIRDAYL